MYRTALPIKPIDASKCYVIAVVSNPVRFRTRYDLARRFAKHLGDAQLYIVEMAFGDRPFEVTEAGNPRHIQLRSTFEMWHKENMINIGISRLPSDWEYVCWIDADISFARDDIIQETVHQLQHYQFVQMFSAAIDLGPPPQMDPIGHNVGFAYCYHNQHSESVPQFLINAKLNHDRHSHHKHKHHHNKHHHGYPEFITGSDGKVYWHPGFAWAARREAIEHVGGLLDTGILGAGDHHMSLALVGRAHEAMPPGVTPGYIKTVMDWQSRCEKYIRRNIGVVPGTITHHWHGRKADRRYWDRWKILTANKFDPFTDLKRDWQGMWQLVDHGDDRSINLRDQLRMYFRQRSEDSIDN